MLMLSCLHDPCINCAAIHYVEHCPRNSLVLLGLFSSTFVPNAKTKLNSTHPVSLNFKESTGPSGPMQKAKTAESKTKSLTITEAYPKLVGKLPTITTTPPKPAITNTKNPSNPRTAILSLSVISPYPLSTSTMNLLVKPYLQQSCVLNIPKMNSPIFVSPVINPYVLSVLFMDSTDNMKSKHAAKQ